jgi:hypothetical protein
MAGRQSEFYKTICLQINMADVHTKKQRSYNMSRIKGKNYQARYCFTKIQHCNFLYMDIFGMVMQIVNILWPATREKEKDIKKTTVFCGYNIDIKLI